MKVTNHGADRSVQNTGRATGEPKVANPLRIGESARPVAEDGARVSVSSRAKNLAAARAAIQEAPDVDAARVEELKQKIASGAYDIDFDKVADRLVNDHMSSLV